MESLEHNCGNILPTIYTSMLIFGKDTIVVLISLMNSTNPISLQILIFVISHFTTHFPFSVHLFHPCFRLVSVAHESLVLKLWNTESIFAVHVTFQFNSFQNHESKDAKVTKNGNRTCSVVQVSIRTGYNGV